MMGRAKLGGGVIGLMFLGVGVINLLRGENWVVWMILGVLLGGLSAFSGKRNG